MSEAWPKGVFTARLIEKLHAEGAITAERAFDTDQVQPASLDLRLGKTAFRVRSSFLPGPAHSVAERIEALKLHEIDLSKGGRAGARLRLSRTAGGKPPPARGCQRLGQSQELDRTARCVHARHRRTGHGASISFQPATRGHSISKSARALFPILVRTGSRLSQMRFRRGGQQAFGCRAPGAARVRYPGGGRAAAGGPWRGALHRPQGRGSGRADRLPLQTPHCRGGCGQEGCARCARFLGAALCAGPERADP
jgi:hypothetical protein